MALLLETVDRITHATLDGELTVLTVSNIQDELFSLLNHANVILDLSKLDELDGCGAQLLAILRLEASRTAKRLTLRYGNPRVEAIMLCLGFAVPDDTGQEVMDGSHAS